MLVFIIMCLMTASHVLMKVLACSMMLRLNQLWFILYMLGDMSLYFLYRIANNDLRYWLRLPGALSWIVSLFSRFSFKIITDFTLIIQFRHPCETGGFYWSFSMLTNQVFCFVSVFLYKRYAKIANETMSDYLLLVVSFLFLFSMVNFGLFLRLIKQKYHKTFYDFRSGK